MVFRLSRQYAVELSATIAYYSDIDQELASNLFYDLKKMEKHLESFPEASALTSEPPIRKFILRRFPIRIRFVQRGDSIIVLTMEHMKQDKPL